jgi:hypothetical protein
VVECSSVFVRLGGVQLRFFNLFSSLFIFNFYKDVNVAAGAMAIDSAVEVFSKKEKICILPI